MFFIGDDDVKETNDGKLEEPDNETAQNAAIAQNPWAYLPPLLDTSEVQWDKWDYPESSSEEPLTHQVTDEALERLYDEHWEGVNGQFDYNNEWHDWTQTYSMPTVNGDLLH